MRGDYSLLHLSLPRSQVLIWRSSPLLPSRSVAVPIHVRGQQGHPPGLRDRRRRRHRLRAPQPGQGPGEAAQGRDKGVFFFFESRNNLASSLQGILRDLERQKAKKTENVYMYEQKKKNNNFDISLDKILFLKASAAAGADQDLPREGGLRRSSGRSFKVNPDHDSHVAPAAAERGCRDQGYELLLRRYGVTMLSTNVENAVFLSSTNFCFLIPATRARSAPPSRWPPPAPAPAWSRSS